MYIIHRLSSNHCPILAKYYLYTASRKEEERYLEAFLSILTSKITFQKHESKSKLNM